VTPLAPSAVAAENARPGTYDWWPAAHAPSGACEAYTTQVSAQPGGRVELCVATEPVARYRVSVYRLGWYDGAGARLVHEGGPSIGLARAAPPPDSGTGLCRAGWPVTDSLYVGEDWTPGQYVAHLRILSGPYEGTSTLVPFVIRRAPADVAALLVQTPVNTVQAYNHWGSKSLYPWSSSDRVAAVKVSFDRPVPAWPEADQDARAPFQHDLALIRFLEREGFDVAYQTNVDTHREPWTLMTATTVISSGHDEYWTTEVRDAFEQARDAGIHLAFLGAGQCHWQARYEDGERTLVAYRSANEDPEPDPARKSVRFRDLEPPRPEVRLIGVRHDGGSTLPSALLDYDVVDGAADDPWGAPLEDRAPLTELVGPEWDALDPDFVPPQLVRLLHCPNELSDADCIRWRAASGTMTFAAGSVAFSQGLDDWPAPSRRDARVEAMLRSVLADMLR
jgi:hypothetical protein